MTFAMHRLGSRASGLLVRLIALLLFGYILFPLIVTIAVSFSDTSLLRFPPSGLSLRWYTTFLQDPDYISSIINSTKVAVAATLIALLLGIPAAAAIALGRLPGAALLSSYFVLPLIVPHVVFGVALLQVASSLGWARSTPILVMGHVILVLPYVVRMMLGAFVGMDPRLRDASLDLGANEFQTFRLVTLPIVSSNVFAAAIFSFVVSWTNVELSIFNAAPDFSLTPLKIFNYVQYSIDPTIAAVSASTIYAAIVLLLAIDLLVGTEKFAGIQK
ncbi:ABC transporter permease [Chelatococcus sp. GCM10030263]|uniref:ABC transporter permease n=1 Tax=Chelatococcus sp. GCM10030263 TaxID=3273387 RepID=UPI00361E956A